MSASFSFDTIPPKLDVNVGAKSHFFQPPKTSASSSLHKSTTSLSAQDVTSITSRKRSRHDSNLSDQSVSFNVQTHASPTDLIYTPSALESPIPLSPLSFVNTQYTLAGGLDTPTAHLAMDEEENEYWLSPDLHLRKGSRGYRSVPDSYFPQSISALSRESNGRSRQHASPRMQYGFKAVYGMVSVAGKVWNFCRTAAFKRFCSGDGQGYEMRPPLEQRDCDQSTWQEAEHENVFQSNLCAKSLVPGCFPEEDFIADYMGTQNRATPPRVAKKARREKGTTGEISASWVLVSRETSPSRPSSGKTLPLKNSARRPRPKLGRRPVLPASRPSLTSFTDSPGLRSDRCASFASPRSPITPPKRESPLAVEVQRQAVRMRKREMEEDANLTRLNQQLKAMIKEGKEALGTKFEVWEPLEELYAGTECVC